MRRWREKKGKGEKSFGRSKLEKKPHAGNWQAVPRTHGRRDCNQPGFRTKGGPPKTSLGAHRSCFQVHVSRGRWRNPELIRACPPALAALAARAKLALLYKLMAPCLKANSYHEQEAILIPRYLTASCSFPNREAHAFVAACSLSIDVTVLGDGLVCCNQQRTVPRVPRQLFGDHS